MAVRIPLNYTSSGIRIPFSVQSELLDSAEFPEFQPTRESYEDDRQFLLEFIPVINAHVDMARQKISAGWTAYFLRITLTKRVMDDLDFVIKAHTPMRCLFYKMVDRMSHNIRSQSLRNDMPIMIGCVDDEWSIRAGKGLNTPGSGFKDYVNSLLLLPPQLQMSETVETHIARHDPHYRRDGIARIEVRPVAVADIPRACRRVFRGVLDGRVPMTVGPIVLPQPVTSATP